MTEPVYYNPDGTVWTPAFKGQRPPFQPGNELAFKEGNKAAVTHGAYTPARVDPLAQQYVEAMMADTDLPPMLRAPYFREAVYGYCMARAKRDLIAEWVSRMPIQGAADSDRGKTSPLELLRKWETTVDGKAKALGLTPAAWVRIHRDLAGAHQADAVTLLTQARAEAERAAITTMDVEAAVPGAASNHPPPPL